MRLGKAYYSYETPAELEAMSERRVTRLGRQIAAVPVDPRLGRMLRAGARPPQRGEHG